MIAWGSPLFRLVDELRAALPTQGRLTSWGASMDSAGRQRFTWTATTALEYTTPDGAAHVVH